MLDPRYLMQNNFERAYKKLDPHQQAAVNSIEGPVLVTGSPGTGKTQLLPIRVANILLSTDTTPGNILCFSHNNIAIDNLVQHVKQITGRQSGDINYHSFGSFCASVLQENHLLLGDDPPLLLSVLEQVQILKKLVDNLPKNHLLKNNRNDGHQEAHYLSNLFFQLKKLGCNLEKTEFNLSRQIDQLQSNILFEGEQTRSLTRKLNTNEVLVTDEKASLEKLQSGVALFNTYQQLLQQQNRYDGADQVQRVIQLFNEHPNLLAQYQQKFLYLLIDDFQETTAPEIQLIQLLIGGQGRPNIFMLSNADLQFGLSPETLINHLAEFINLHSGHIKTITLERNYRSAEPIVNLAKIFASQYAGSQSLSYPLTSTSERSGDVRASTVITAYDSDTDEMTTITEEVYQLLNKGVNPSAIAIIYNEHSFGRTMAQYFRLKRIPVNIKRNVPDLHHPLSRKLLRLLQYLQEEQDEPFSGDHLLFEILHYDFFNIPSREIANLLIEAYQQRHQGKPTALRWHISEKSRTPAKDLFDHGIPETLKNTSIILESLIAELPVLSLKLLFDKLISTTGLMNYILQRPDKADLLKALNDLANFIKEETTRNPSLGLAEFIFPTGLLQKSGQRRYTEQLVNDAQSIHLLTTDDCIDKEFEYVFLAGLNGCYWEKSTEGSLNILSNPADHISERETLLRRQFYTAITRAKKGLFLSYSLWKQGRPMEPSRFITEITSQQISTVKQLFITSQIRILIESTQLLPGAPEIEKLDEVIVERLLGRFVMNVTALNNFLGCPLCFYFQNLLRVPSGKNEALEFGSAIHNALEKLFNKMQESKKGNFPAVEELVADFKTCLYERRMNFNNAAFDRRLKYGEEILQNYYWQYIYTWNKIVSVERNISGVFVAGVPIRGKADKLEFNGKEINVVDYKTGDIDKAKRKLLPPNEENPNGGDYWRQAVFYKLLIDHYGRKDWKVVSTEFDFIEPDKNNRYHKEKIVITQADIETVKQQISFAWKKIQAKQFYRGCGQETCYWCNFVKDNRTDGALPVPFINQQGIK